MVDMPSGELRYLGTSRCAMPLGSCRKAARMVKLEGGGELAETIRQLSRNGVPVCAHLGLMPQSVHKLGGYGVQGRE
ncbi:MAG: 3-methyl-2-oxobutanoate hydroxymethyltransferase [Candidatus Competibacteraceae bacterium]